MACITRLPQPVSEVWDWQLRGACRSMSSEVFFHPEQERGRARARRQERAKQICRQCPVMAECREHALAVEEPFGIWGGLDEQERRAILASRRRAAAAADNPPAGRAAA
ncbi:WhiB family transcriptional regulator [Goodfellowiella coeruleoviolacea]|uniref:Transcriptional regulator WhiB n=1 Tax=Goodfellowiella coeruleoviolacea TaxID=334858 RepID=A0AAE3G8P2_9PSEU|nr:WhiB family transcriptional regulator [Goodfellowiella coeruleoviolacea]MCP2163756.1 WhiB family transcriptional regulator, redox-sensing transcriptional regulator [Goodfellowiella coeruleoviolacea]